MQHATCRCAKARVQDSRSSIFMCHVPLSHVSRATVSCVMCHCVMCHVPLCHTEAKDETTASIAQWSGCGCTCAPYDRVSEYRVLLAAHIFTFLLPHIVMCFLKQNMACHMYFPACLGVRCVLMWFVNIVAVWRDGHNAQFPCCAHTIPYTSTYINELLFNLCN